MRTPFTIQETPVTEALTNQLYEGFRQHAIEVVGHDNELKRFCYTATHDGTFAGAIIFHLVWETVQIRQLFIEAPFRKQGLGTILMNMALNVGKEADCRVAFVETMSFQAKAFYEQLGFTLEYSRSGFANNFQLHLLKKDPL